MSDVLEATDFTAYDLCFIHWVLQKKRVFVKDLIVLSKQLSMAVKGVDFTYSGLCICSIIVFSEMKP